MHGLAHIGVIQELEARGVDVRVVAGTDIHRMSRTASFDELGEFAASF